MRKKSMSWFDRVRKTLNTRETSSDTSSANVQTDEPLQLNEWQRKFVLSLDGGGIRGLSSLFILQELMSKVSEIERRYEPEATHSFYPDPFIPPKEPMGAPGGEKSAAYKYLPCHYFDLIVGTSTGGLIAIMLGRLRMSIDDCIEEYKQVGREVFGHPRRMHIKGSIRKMKFNPKKDKYSAKPLRSVVDRVISERDPFSSGHESDPRASPSKLETPTDLCHTVVCTVEGTSSKVGYLFRSFHWPEDDVTFQRNQATYSTNISDVALATTAAPGYFKPMRIGKLRFYDGGLAEVNPCKYGVQEIQDYYGQRLVNRGVVAGAISIGTGKIKEVKIKNPRWWMGRYAEMLQWEKNRATDPIACHQAMLAHARNMNTTLHDVGCEHFFTYARFTVGVTGESGDDGFVISEAAHQVVQQMAGMKMDEWEGNTVRKIQDASRAYIRLPKIQERLIEFAELLVNHRRRRSQSGIPEAARDEQCTLQWYRYASASKWRCMHGHDKCSITAESRVAMENHMRSKHGQALQEHGNAKRELCATMLHPRF